jgi:hypothetical protein
VLDVAAGSGNAALAAELASCLDRFNRATDGTLFAPADYLQVVAVRAAS